MSLGKVNNWLLAVMTVVILGITAINFTTSYNHIFILAFKYGEDGTSARLTPAGIDGMLFVLAMVNVLAARLHRTKGVAKWRWALGLAVASTVAANGAYGNWWGTTGTLIAVWSPIALFVAVEAGLQAFRWAAEYVEEQTRTAQNMTAEELELDRRRKAAEASRRSREKRRGQQDPAPQGNPLAGNVQNNQGADVTLQTTWG